jgi:4-hydroxybenzoate polyprenyltransferase
MSEDRERERNISSYNREDLEINKGKNTAVSANKRKEVNMLSLLLVIGIILFILWILGFSIGFLSGPLLWILLIIGIILVISWLVPTVRRRR